ncbi:hypothetical protein RND71_033924 [Anisodus tanguticus]|uniref:RWP-RK domain-containing protein n=1 Tax=Anisodus tanguticus TaxID=243964 RepID=A0AAE1R8N7_9SOLA|nr:hypothetical protein RND71_033924 [Anisodus tanguticus]
MPRATRLDAVDLLFWAPSLIAHPLEIAFKYLLLPPNCPLDLVWTFLGKKLLDIPQPIKSKKRRAAKTEDIARLSLEDLAKYIDLPIVEASKKLKVGLTEPKKKCREFGIPRWPCWKIKSLGSLILDLQKEVQRQKEEDELAATIVEERKRMIEYERESIEKKPFMEDPLFNGWLCCSNLNLMLKLISKELNVEAY